MVGPGVDALVSTSNFDLGDAAITGGGSITECAGDLGTIGSGNAGIGSPVEVSMVICFVGGDESRGV